MPVNFSSVTSQEAGRELFRGPPRHAATPRRHVTPPVLTAVLVVCQQRSRCNSRSLRAAAISLSLEVDLGTTSTSGRGSRKMRREGPIAAEEVLSESASLRAELARLREEIADLRDDLFVWRDPAGLFRPYCGLCGVSTPVDRPRPRRSRRPRRPSRRNAEEEARALHVSPLSDVFTSADGRSPVITPGTIPFSDDVIS